MKILNYYFIIRKSKISQHSSFLEYEIRFFAIILVSSIWS